MKFCPNCGSPRDNKDKCECGYNYLTGEVEKEEKNTTLYEMHNTINSPIFDMPAPFNIDTYQGVITLEELKNKKVDYGELLGISYVTSGGMMGMYHSISLDLTKKELIDINQEWHHAPKTTNVYKVDDDTIDKIKKIIIDNNMGVWNEIPINNLFIAMDAPTSSMCLKYEKKSVSMSSLINTDHEETQIYMKLQELVYSSIKKENIISEETTGNTEPSSLNSMMMNPTNSQEPIKYRTFCPECGSGLLEDQYVCNTCGYEDKRGEKNE